MRDLSRCVHHPAVSQDGYASLAIPTHRASTIVFPDAQAYADRAGRGPDGYSYGMHGTPTTRTLEAQLSALHGAARTMLLPSGQAAVTTAFLTLLLQGDHVLVPASAYPPVLGFCRHYLAPRGVTHTVYDPMIGAGIAALMTPRTRLVWLESPGSTTMEVQDFGAIAAAAHAAGALAGCDNTWATPLLFKPLDHGADLVMEALTKYVGGHSDLLLGALSVRDMDLRRRLKDTMRMVGMSVSPDEVALALRGIETMGVRLAHAGRVALDFATRLQAFPAARRVLHPALPSCPGHDDFTRDFRGGSGLFSVMLPKAADAVLGPALTAMRLFAIGASWGGTRSLVAPMTVKADRTEPWIEDGTILRISVGMEDADDLWEDLAALFTALGRAC